jgi:hypothetical protein
LKSAEVVAELALLPSGEMIVHRTYITTEEIIVDPIVMEQLSQDEFQGGTHRVSLGSDLVKANSEALNLPLVRDEFDGDMFDWILANEHNVDETDESSSSESDKENIETLFDTGHEAPNELA